MNLDVLNNPNWSVLLAVCCVLPVLVLLLLSIVVIRTGQRWVTPDEGELRARFEKLRAQNPSFSTDQLVRSVIHQQAVRAGVIGAITSVGGLFLLPLGLIFDLYTSARIQTTMLHFIAWAYAASLPQGGTGQGGAGRTVNILGLNEALVLRAEEQAQQFVLERSSVLAGRLYRRVMLIIVEKTFAKLIPGIGLLVGFIVNYTIARGIGQVAAGWYSGRVAQVAQSAVQGVLPKGSP
jgi:hypothetical protein